VPSASPGSVRRRLAGEVHPVALGVVVDEHTALAVEEVMLAGSRGASSGSSSDTR